MSNNYILNWVKKNPTVATIFAFMIVVIIILIVMATAKMNDNDKNEEVDGGSGKPEIEVLDMNKILLPDSTNTSEGYMINEGYDVKTLAKNINFTLEWNNKSGFETVESLIFRRYATQYNTANQGLVQTTKIMKDTTTYSGFFTNFKQGNSFTFHGTDLTSPTTADVRGVNRFTIYYTVTGSTTESKMFDSSESFTGANVPTVTDADLTLTLSLITVKQITYNPTVVNFSLNKMTDKTTYYMYPGGGSVDLYNGIKQVIRPVKFEPVIGSTDNEFYITFPVVNEYLTVSSTMEMRSEASSGGATMFRYPKGYYLAQVTTSRTSATKFILANSPMGESRKRIRVSNNTNLFLGAALDEGKTVFLDITDENITSELYKTIDIEISTIAKDVKCSYRDEVIGCDSNNKKIWKRVKFIDNGNCDSGTIPFKDEECDRDATCTEYWNPCPVICGGTNTKQTIERIETTIPSTGNGIPCPTTKEPKDCGQQTCTVGRTCDRKVDGNLVLRGDACAEKIAENPRCSWNQRMWTCEGGYYDKLCPSNTLPGEPGCELQQGKYENEDLSCINACEGWMNTAENMLSGYPLVR